MLQEIIAQELNKKQIKHVEVAKHAGITTRALEYYRKGERIPRYDVAERILEALGISIVLERR